MVDLVLGGCCTRKERVRSLGGHVVGVVIGVVVRAVCIFSPDLGVRVVRFCSYLPGV